MDAAGRLAHAVADSRHHAGPSSAGLEVGEVGIEQEVRGGRIAEAAGLQIAFGNRACQRCATGKDAGNLVAVVGFCWSRGSRRSRTVKARAPGRFLE